MAEIIPFDDRHITMQDVKGDVHVVPVTVFEQIMAGEMEIESLEDWRVIVRSIIWYWLEIMEDKD